MPFGQHQDTELWNNQFPETKILGLPVSRRMRGLVYMASRDKVDVYTFQKSFNTVLEKLGKSKFGFERTAHSNFKSKRHECSVNELVDYSRAPCLGADQKACGLWERDWRKTVSYEEQIMSKDKYPNIFSPPNGGYCLYYPSNLFRNAHNFENWEIYISY